ncbi:MAG: membrane protein insertion efficiency factor YidD [Cellvibrionaceae bacterium]
MAKNSAQSLQLITRFPAILAIKFIRAYQLIASPWVGNQCRFYPSCSHYAIDAYKQQGFIKGSWLTLKRVLKCNPWHSGGIDHVPIDTETKETKTLQCCQTRADNSKTTLTNNR